MLLEYLVPFVNSPFELVTEEGDDDDDESSNSNPFVIGFTVSGTQKSCRKAFGESILRQG
jgi:hypothetical protein